MIKAKRFISGLAALNLFFTVLAFSSCRNTYDTPEPQVNISGVTVNPTTKDVRVGVDDSFTVSATVSPTHATNTTVTWTVEPAGIIAVASTSGNTATISILAQGVAYVTATTNGTTDNGEHKSAECKVTVSPTEGALVYVDSVTLDRVNLFLDLDDIETLVATVHPAEAYLDTVTWVSTNPAVATVNGGVVTVVGYGQAIIIATSVGENAGGQHETASATVTAIDPNVPPVYVESITLNKNALSMKVGDTNNTLTATVNPPETFGIAQWRSDNTAVASINENGVLTAHAIGTANITAYSTFTENGVEISSPACIVTVIGSSLTAGAATPATDNLTIIPKPTGINWTRYEAENANIYPNNTGKETANYFSGGFAVNASENVNILTDSIDLTADWTTGNDIGYIHFEVYAETAGTYTVRLVYNGNDNKQVLIKLNNDVSYFLPLPELEDFGWSRLISQEFTLGHFNQGWNDLYISGLIDSLTGDPDYGGWANIDCIDINSSNPAYTPIQSISLNPNSLTLQMGAVTSGTLTAAISPLNASNQDLIWSVDDDANPPGCITVNQSGVVTASYAGTATVTVTAVDIENGVKSASCAVTVLAATSDVYVSGITVSPATLHLLAGQSSPALTALIAPNEATNKAITWHSSDPAIATVNSIGEVTALARGTVNIYAQSTHTQGGSEVNSNNCVVTVSVNQLIDDTIRVVSNSNNSATDTFYPEQSGFTRHEAEAAAFSGTAKTRTADSYLYSDGTYVEEIVNSINAANFPTDWTGLNYVKFTVTVPTDGEYQVNIITNGHDPKTVMVKVNDDPHQAHAMTIPDDSNWTSIFAIQLRLGALKAGVPNYISIAVAGNQWMNIDCIDVSIAPLP